MKKMLGLLIGIFVLFSANAAEENPERFFADLTAKYKNAEREYTPVESKLDDGMALVKFDSVHKIAPDVFCEIILFSSLGQTQYQVYRKHNEETWYIHKTAIFYDKPYGDIETAEKRHTYFRFSKRTPYVFNSKTKLYDIQADTSEFQAVVDTKNLEQLIVLVEAETSNASRQ
jgi:hypothetical protein